MAFRKNTAEAFEVLRQMAEQKKARASEAAAAPPGTRGGETGGASLSGRMTSGTVISGTVTSGTVSPGTVTPGTPEAMGSTAAGASPTRLARVGAGRIAGQREGRFQRTPLLRAPTPGRTLAGGQPRPSPAQPPRSPPRRGEARGARRPERPRSRAWTEWMEVEGEAEAEMGSRSVSEREPPIDGAQVLATGSSERPAAQSHDRERFSQGDARFDAEREALLEEARPGDSRPVASPNIPLHGRPAIREETHNGFFDDWSLADGPDPLLRPHVDPVLLVARSRPCAVGASVPVSVGLEAPQSLRIDILPPTGPASLGPERGSVEPALGTAVTTPGTGQGGPGDAGGEPPGRFSGGSGPPAAQVPEPQVPEVVGEACGAAPASRGGSRAPGAFFRRVPRENAVSARAGSGLLALLDRHVEMKLSTLLVLAMGGVIAVTLCLSYVRMPAPEDPYFAQRREGSLVTAPSAAGSGPSEVSRAGMGAVTSPPSGLVDVASAPAPPGVLRQPIWGPSSAPSPEVGGRLEPVREEPPLSGEGQDRGTADSNTGARPARPPASREASPLQHMIQVKARESYEGAQRIITYLDDFGFGDSQLDPDPRGGRDSDGKGLYTVFVGRFTDREEAQQECQRLKRETRLRPYKNREDFFHDSLVITRRR